MIKGLRLDENGKLDIPENKRRIKFDVGLSWDAPNSSLWLNRESDLFVIGIEPNKYAVSQIRERGTVLSMVKKNRPVEINDDNYMLLECAIDNVERPTKRVFYSMSSTDDKWAGCPGCSSLLEPTDKLKNNKQEITSKDEVDVVPFFYLLDMVPWERFGRIDLIKTDCQGKDFDVVKSMGNYLSRIIYLNCELSTFGNYVNETNTFAFLDFLKTNGFKRLSRKHGEFVNTSLEWTAIRSGVSNKCMNI